MSSPTAGFDPLAPPDTIPFFTKLQHITFQFDPSSAPSGLPEQGINQEGSIAQLDNMLASMGNNITNPALAKVFPRTWDQFVTDARTIAFGQSSAGNTMSGPLFDGFFQDFLQILQVSQGGLQGLTTSQLQTMFVDDFNQFLKTYPFQSNGDAGPTSYLIDQWHKFMTVVSVENSTLATGNYSNLSAYQTIFYAFFPNGTASDYATLRDELITQMESSSGPGYFTPSQMLSEWYEKVQQAYVATQLGGSILSPLSGTDSQKVDVLWKVFNLAVSMIGTLQNVASAEAQRLNFLTQWQSDYTNLMATIPVFTKGDSSPFAGTDDSSSSTRQELNPKNQVLSQNLQSFRDQLSDQAKSVQANVNNLNDSVNQQSSLADSILQEMSTILQSIFASPA